ncbi:glycosyltransferase family 2 protein [Imhoffiella purpurea]|uniref:glycosyltransferase family 2 protein n=1 Tax=Imhoffiella purpurea TaxID=1249627 RepID=UPI0009DE3ECF|nr:glycosyltransferase family 2 protein [Imhoffiella purpurea]
MISVVIPVYRALNSLEELYARINVVFCGIGVDYEVLFVEDCGGDDSWSIIQKLARDHASVRGIKMSRNYGQHNALLCGVREARGSVIVTMDDDLQHPPEELPKLLNKLDEGYDVVYGPPESEQHGLLRDLASQITKIALQSAMGAESARHASAFRVFRAEIRDAFSAYRSPSVNIDVLLTWGAARFAAVHVRHDSRKYGESGYTPRKLIRHALNMMTGFSTRPLQMASMLGFVFSLFGACVLAYVCIHYLFYGSRVPGFAFLASIIAIFSGVQLLALGVIGEYIALMYFRSMERPPYLVREQTYS